jgi:phosphoribosylformylglycinamidine synthase II/phosphoribosylformylglycinamidine synthase I
MPTYRIEVWRSHAFKATVGTGQLATDLTTYKENQVGYTVTRLYFICGELTPEEIHHLSAELLVDPAIESYSVLDIHEAQSFPQANHSIEVTTLPGVTDPVAENLVKAAHQIGLTNLEQAATGTRYLLADRLSKEQLHQLASGVLSNEVIQRYEIDRPIAPPFVLTQDEGETVEIIPVCTVDDQALLQISANRRLALNLEEMRAIRGYFQQEGRDPTDVELETLAQTWSEHCVHKTFKAKINYTGPPAGRDRFAPVEQQTINGLLNTYIRRATEDVNRPWVRSAFVDNAGIVRFDDRWDLAFKVETHNHPSALEPFGGANTGVGGVVRDVLGVSARPIANTDVLCFGVQDMPPEKLPKGVLHPRRIQDGVVDGIEDYGNKMGIPTVSGAIYYHPEYTSNPLVFCGCLGILPHGSHPTEAQPGDLIVVIGGRTGRDGLRGATFSSMEMDQTTGEVAGSAVQIGHPINEKQTLEVILQARDEELYNAVTDCGAGGLSSAVGEMGRAIGARVQLADVPLKYRGLYPWEIWLSEAQERMVLAIPPENWERLKAICELHQTEITCIGTFEPTGRLRLHHKERLVGDMALEFLHDGIPLPVLDGTWEPKPPTDLSVTARPADPTAVLLELLAHPNIRSKEDVIRRYDHEVQGGTAVKPLTGAGDHGPGDATVLVPLDTLADVTGEAGPRGAALAVGICPAYTQIDPYAMAWAAIDEAMRNVVAVGADPDQVALLDNFCWGNPNLPDRLGSLVRAAQACYEAAVTYQAPFISGKDSLNNEFVAEDGKKHAIPGTLMISALGIVPDLAQAVTMDLKEPGNMLYVVGETSDELGGSHYALVRGIDGGEVPQPQEAPLTTMQALHRAIQAGLVRACHDCSEGGLGVALAEMCLSGRLGAHVALEDIAPTIPTAERPDAALFSESLTRFVVEVRPEDERLFVKTLDGVFVARLGEVTQHERLVIDTAFDGGERLVDVTVARLESAWRGGLPAAPIPGRPNRGERSLKISVPAAHTAPKRIAIMHAKGTNRDRDAIAACELAGGAPEIVYINEVVTGQKNLLDYHMLIMPGGFSYGDDLGGGVLWAFTLMHQLGQGMREFVQSGRPVLGICNGFQALVKAGLLPGPEVYPDGRRTITLTHNERGAFECRWVYLKASPTCNNLFVAGHDELVYCPVAHGEGRLMTADEATLGALEQQNLIALTYITAEGSPADYPDNPNGSLLGIAGLGNLQGNVLGLMPHPENHIYPWQHPRWQRGERGMTGLRLFENGIKNA